MPSVYLATHKPYLLFIEKINKVSPDTQSCYYRGNLAELEYSGTSGWDYTRLYFKERKHVWCDLRDAYCCFCFCALLIDNNINLPDNLAFNNGE